MAATVEVVEIIGVCDNMLEVDYASTVHKLPIGDLDCNYARNHVQSPLITLTRCTRVWTKTVGYCMQLGQWIPYITELIIPIGTKIQSHGGLCDGPYHTSCAFVVSNNGLCSHDHIFVNTRAIDDSSVKYIPGQITNAPMIVYATLRAALWTTADAREQSNACSSSV